MLRTPLLMPKNNLKWLVYKPFGQLCIPILWFCKTARQSERAYNDSYSFDNKRAPGGSARRMETWMASQLPNCQQSQPTTCAAQIGCGAYRRTTLHLHENSNTRRFLIRFAIWRTLRLLRNAARCRGNQFRKIIRTHTSTNTSSSCW